MKIEYLDAEIERKIMTHREINKSALSRKYDVDRHTISRHLEKIEGKTLTRKKKECAIQKYDEVIKEKLLDGCSIKSIYMSLLNLTTIGELKSYSNFKQYIRRWYSDYKIEGKTNEARYRYETAPGEQMQFDWVTPLSLHLKDGSLITFNLWNATLGFNRKHYYRVTDTITEQDVKQA